MRLYKVSAPDQKSKFLGSQAECVTQRKVLLDAGVKRKDMTETTVDVPTDKAGLIQWLNDNAT